MSVMIGVTQVYLVLKKAPFVVILKNVEETKNYEEKGYSFRDIRVGH